MNQHLPDIAQAAIVGEPFRFTQEHAIYTQSHPASLSLVQLKWESRNPAQMCAIPAFLTSSLTGETEFAQSL